jgi:hypothetical protein
VGLVLAQDPASAAVLIRSIVPDGAAAAAAAGAAAAAAAGAAAAAAGAAAAAAAETGGSGVGTTGCGGGGGGGCCAEGESALRVGPRAGDRLVEVAGQRVRGLRLEEVARLLAGPAGEPVALTLLRGPEPAMGGRDEEGGELLREPS